MAVPIAHAVKSSKSYEEEGAFDIWANLGLKEVEEQESFETGLVELDFPDEDAHITIEAVRPPLGSRLKSVFAPVPVLFKYTKVWKTLKSDAEDTDLTKEERLAQRRWLLANEQSYSPTKKIPTPTEQGAAALALVTDTIRDNPALAEAIDKLPKPDELLIQLPREISYEDKKRIQKIVKAIMMDKPVNAKVKL